ncbi:MAG TPA: elongation factor G [Chloroflexota bacterium]|nr:elongation factor G [Chloroflexota bacterium]
MKVYSSTRIRNVALLSHSGAGKTSLAEAMLYDSGAVGRLGRVDDGTTASDSDPDEVKRKISLNLGLLPCEWRDTKLNVIDTPGYADFVGEVVDALYVADSALLTVCGASGIEVGTEQDWQRARERNLPVILWVNKLDREHSDFDRAVEQARTRLKARAVAVQLPIGRESGFRGVVDLISGRAYVTENGKTTETDAPPDLEEDIATYRDRLCEAVAEADDSLIDKYLEGEPLSNDELRAGLRSATWAGALLPVLCGSALQNIGIVPLLDFLVEYLPNPLEGQHGQAEDGGAVNGATAAVVFKTVADPFGKLSMFRLFGGDLKSDAHLYNVNRGHDERITHLLVVRGKSHEVVPELHAGDIGAALKLQDTNTGDTLALKEKQVRLAPIAYPEPSYSAAIEPKTRADLDKLGGAMARLIQEDPTLHWHRDPETSQSILSGMGESHLQVAVDRLHRKFGADVTLGEPKVPYRETISLSAKAQGRHKRQTGGHGQFGDVWLEVEPLPRGSGYEFADKVVGGSVPRQFIPAVDKGIQEALHAGILTGSPVVDIRVTLYDGSFHQVDSSEMAFKTAAAIGFHAACEKARPVLLEPIMDVRVDLPSEYMGDVVGDLNAHRARILGMDPSGDGMTQIAAHVPMAEMFRYATTLRSLTQGRASYTMHVLGYEEAPSHVAQQVAQTHQHEKEQREHK